MIFVGSLSGASSVVYAYLGEMMPNKVRTKLMVLFGNFVGVTVIVMCLVGWIVNRTQPAIHFSDSYVLTPWRIQWLILLIPGFCGIFLYWYLPESPHFLTSIGDTDGALAALREVYTKNNRGVGEFPVKSIISESNGHDEHKKNL